MCEGGCERCGYCSQCEGYEGCGMECRQMYGMRCGGRHYLLRWILGVLILVIVFFAGIKLGEFKQDMRGGYGYGMMNRGYNAMPGYGMMQWRDGANADAYYRYGMMRGAEAPKQATPVQ